MHQHPDLILERQPGGLFLPRSLTALKSESKVPANRPLELLALEDRVLYSAVPLDPQTSQPETEPNTEPLNLDWQLASLEHWAELLKVDEADTIPGPLLTSVDEPNKPEKETVLVVLDKGIADFELLLNDIQSHFPTEYSLLLIDSTTDGWQQLSQYLENRKGIEEVHLFSHAVSGALQLGTSRVDLDDLLSEETSAIWQRALHQEADILLYGCDLAATPSGATFVSQFALFSGADVAASIDRTGTYVNSNWDLEFTVGQFSSESLFHSSDRLTWEGALDAQNINIPNAQNLTALDRGSTNSVAMHSDGSYVIVWSHDWGTDWDIRAARFNADGTQNGSVFTVNQTITGDQRYASVDMDDAGNFIVTWTSPSESPGSADIWARWFEAGSGSSSEFRVNSYTPSGQYNSSVSMAGDGRFAIAWEGNGTEDSQGIFVRLYDANRNAIGNQVFVNPTSAGSQEDPVVSMNDSGQFIVAWHDETAFRYQRFDSAGNKIGNANVISSIGTARHGDVLLNNDGTVVITWQEHNGTMWDVFWQRNAADDSPLTAKTLIRSNLSTDQLAPAVDGSGAGDFVIAWEAGEFSDTWGVFYQLYNSSGLATPYTFWANNNYSSGFQGNASVGVNSLEQFVVVWSGQSSFDSNDIGHNNVSNHSPTPTSDTGTAIENGGYNNSTPGTGATGNVLGNDTDPDIGDTLSLLGVVAGSGGFSTSNLGTSLAGLYGTLILNSDGEYTYSINNSLAAVQALRTNADTLTDTFTYTVRDQGSLSATATLTITLRGRNDAPHAVADSATAVEAGGLANGTSGSNPSGNALSNDTDPDAGDTKTVSGVAAGTLGSASGNVGTAVLGTYGSLTMAADGTFSYSVDNSNSVVQALRSSSQTVTDVFTYTFRDTDGLSSTTQLTITIEGANDTPQISVLGPVSIDENSVNGTVLTSASHSDVDAGETHAFTLSNDAGGRFTVNSSTGAISIANSTLLNYESATSHTITVRVTDLAGAFSEQTLTITLNDVNEFGISSITDTNGTANSLAENSANGSLARITALASDSDGSATVNYSLDDDAGGRFAINSSTGVVSVANNTLLNFELANSHSITVRATSSDGSSTTQTFAIAITDLDEFNVTTPVDNNPAVNELVENSAAGTLVGVTAFASDADGSNNTITYSLTNNAGGRFTINSSTGVVTLTTTSVNYEQATSHTITVRALSSDGSGRTQNFTINVLDNGAEVSGITDVNATANSYAENAALGGSVLTANATHAGSLPLTWSLTNNAGGRFAIDSATGVVTLAATLNYETGTSHTITIRADASDGSFAANNFTISVTDIDEFDVGAITDSNVAANSVAENSANGTATGLRAAATDADGSTNTITYTLDNNAGGRFAINSSTGVVTVANTALLNFEAATSHSITVRATSADGSFSTANFSIILTDIDEFDVDPLTDVDTNINSISENAANGTLVGITAWTQDADATTNTITYSLDDSAGGRFAINSSTGVVTVADGSLLNYESASSHSITVRATSADNSSATQSFTIGVTNQNEIPTAVNDTADAIEAGGVSNGTSGSHPTGNVLTNDSDPDIGDGKSVIGVASGTPASASGFVGSSVAGLYGSVIINADGSYTYSLNNSNSAVQALRTASDTLVDTFTYTMTDSAGSSSTARLSVSIAGANDHPTAQWSEAGLQINSGSSNNQYVELQDFDELIAGESEFTLRISVSTTQSTFFLFSYASNSDDNEFRIYSYNGTLRLSFDDQDWNTGIASSVISDGLRHEIAVVRDSSIAQLKLFVDGQLMAQNNGIKWLVNVDSGGTAVLAQEQDSNGGSFNSQQYFRGTLWDLSFYDSAWSNNRVADEAGVVNSSASDLRGHWTFDQLNGSQLDEQVANHHGLLRSLSGGGWVTGSAQIAQTDWLNSIDEHSGNGLSIGTLEASELDAGDVLNWSLSDDAGGRFAINASTGEITIANSALVDRETAGSFQIMAVATDIAGGTIERAYTIQIRDLDEFDIGLIADGNIGSNEISENAVNGSTIGLTALAIDADATNSAITYSLDDSAGGRFAINAATGVVTVANGTLLNREAASSHTITVRASSSDGSSTTRSFSINVIDSDEFDVGPVSDINPAANLVAENAGNGTLVGITGFASDQDETNNSITYSLDESAGGRFSINSSTGVVTVANGTMLNREAAGSHTITIRATSADNSSSVQSFVINIVDVDEFDVDALSDLNPAVNKVAENSANGTLVGLTITASDLDATNNAITYTLDESAGGRFAIDESTGVVTVANGSLLDHETASTHSITVRASSVDGSSSIGVFAIDVDNLNEGPVAIADQASVSEAGGLGNASGGSGATGNVLTNDLDPDTGETLTIVGFQAGSLAPPLGPLGVPLSGLYGTLLLNADGSYTYSVDNSHPDVEALRNSSETLQDTFSYRIRDGAGLESTSQLVLTITGTNDNPAAMWSETGVGINAGAANNQYLQVSNFGNLLAGNEFTLRLAISTTSSSGTFFSYATSSDHNELRLNLSNSKLLVYLDGQQWVTDVASNLLNDGQRHELTVTRNAASGRVDVFLDGQLKDTHVNWKTGIRLGSGGTLVLGQDQDSIGGGFDSSDAFHGTYWDMSVYSTAWNATRLNLAGGQTVHSDPDLLGHWDFDLLGGNSILDLIAGRHGSLLSITPSSDWIAGTAELVQADWKPRVAENTVTGTVISQLQAYDVDAGENLTWSLLDDAGGRFAIDSNTGWLSVADSELLNFEQQQTHTIVVVVTDIDGLSRQEAYTIHLADVQETGVSVPVDLNQVTNRVDENSATGATTGIQVWAVDEDGTTNDVTYSLLDDAGGRFSIDSQSGVISVLNGSLLNREQAGSHQVSVRATSQDGSFSLASFTIELSDVDEFDLGPISDLDSQDNLVPENSVVGTYTGIAAIAEDQDATHNIVSWRLLDDDGGRFSIDPATGQIFTAKSLDFETIGSIRNVRVEGLSADGSSSVVVFEIQIGDVLTESYTVFSGLELAITPLDLLLTDSEKAEKYQTLTFSDVPGMGQLFVVGSQGKQAISAGELSQFAIPVGQKVIYEAPSTTSGTVTLGYSAATATGQTRTGTVTIQVEPAVVVAPAVQASSVFNSSSSSSDSSSSNSGSSSTSNSSSGDSSTQPKPPGGETAAGAGASGDSVGFGGTASGAVGPLPASGGGNSDQTADELMATASAVGESANGRNGESRTAAGDRGQAAERSEASLQLSYGTPQSSNGNNLQGSTEGTAVTRVLASAASIQQQFLATAQFSEYLSKLDSALEETPLIVGFEMPAYATAGASLFTVGYVAWLIRGGVLLTSFMSSIPSWQSFDPLPILENAGSGDDDLTTDGNDSSIAELVDSEHPASSMAVSPG
jgi:VCBS repeat-containing protein